MNKNNLLFLAIIFMYFLVGCNSKQTTINNSGISPAEKEKLIQRGEAFEYIKSDLLDIHSLLNKMKTTPALQTTVTGEVENVCLKKGCWMTIKNPDGDPMRVTFKDYGFFMPMDIHNKQVIFKGKAYQDTTSVDMLRHYAEDEGLPQAEINKISEPKVEVAFEATGVYIE